MEGRDGITQAMRCIRAMDGQDDETRKALWRAAIRYANRDREASADWERADAPLHARRGSLSGERAC